MPPPAFGPRCSAHLRGADRSLAVSGVRIGEAIRLGRDDVLLESGGCG